MSTVMIRCPTTGRAVSSAIEIEPGVFHQLPPMSARMQCPACGQEHGWNVDDAWLSDEAAAEAKDAPAAENEAA